MRFWNNTIQPPAKWFQQHVHVCVEMSMGASYNCIPRLCVCVLTLVFFFVIILMLWNSRHYQQEGSAWPLNTRSWEAFMHFEQIAQDIIACAGPLISFFVPLISSLIFTLMITEIRLRLREVVWRNADDYYRLRYFLQWIKKTNSFLYNKKNNAARPSFNFFLISSDVFIFFLSKR